MGVYWNTQSDCQGRLPKTLNRRHGLFSIVAEQFDRFAELLGQQIVWRLKGSLGGLHCAYQGDDHDDPDTQGLLGIYVATQLGEGG
jgi:hypothetical protein